MDDETNYTVSVWLQAVFGVLALMIIAVGALVSGDDMPLQFAVLTCFAVVGANVCGQWSIVMRNNALRWLSLGLWATGCGLAILALLTL